MKTIKRILEGFSNLFDPGWYADRISTKFGLYDKAKKSSIRKWALGLTGWKWWAWQIVGGLLFVIVVEFILNKIGMTMLPWR